MSKICALCIKKKDINTFIQQSKDIYNVTNGHRNVSAQLLPTLIIIRNVSQAVN